MQLFLQTFVNGIIAGFIFSLLALGFGLIYSSTGILHFAHGVVFTAGAYLIFVFAILLSLPTLWVLVFVVPLAGLLGLLMNLLVYTPLRRRSASPGVMLISSLGLFIFLENLIGLIFGYDIRVVSKGRVSEGYLIGSVAITQIQIITILTTLACFVAILLFLKKTRFGKAARAMACDNYMAGIIGIDTERVAHLIFFIGSCLAAVAAALISFDLAIRPDMGLLAVLIAAVAVIIGGVGNIFASILGGFLISFVQNFGIMKISQKWQGVITFAVLVVFLIFRPTGFFGKKV